MDMQVDFHGGSLGSTVWRGVAPGRLRSLACAPGVAVGLRFTGHLLSGSQSSPNCRLHRARPRQHKTGMDDGRFFPGIWGPVASCDVVAEGQAVLRALGGRALAREFRLRARDLSSREQLAELLLEFLLRARRG